MKFNEFTFTIFCLITISCASIKPQVTKISLAEFSKSVTTKEEINFFRTNGITDYTKTIDDFIKNDDAFRFSKPHLLFKWSGFSKTGGCETPLGICIILRSPTDTLSRVWLTNFQNKLIIFPLGVENGLTRDGYLPIFSDVEIDQVTIKELELKGNYIKAGIYKANLDLKQNKIVGIAVDVK